MIACDRSGEEVTVVTAVRLAPVATEDQVDLGKYLLYPSFALVLTSFDKKPQYLGMGTF